MTYNFTNGTSIIGSAIHTNTTSIYDLSLDIELLTAMIIIIMLCSIVQTTISILFLWKMIK